MEDTILEKFYNYWQLLPSSAENINNQIYLDISFYIKKNQNDKKSKSTVVAVVLETHLQEFFEINLIKYPYPICQILQLLPENVITENIFTNCLVKLCTRGVEQQTETNGSSIIITNTAVVPNDIETLKILNLLLHFNEKHFCKIANICIPNIWKLFIENSPQTKKISNDLFLCLCARNDNGQLLQLFLDYDDNKQQEQQHKITNNFFNKKYIFMETIKNQKHFLNELIAKPLEYHRIQLKRHNNQLKQTKLDYGTDDTIIPTIMLIKVLQLIHDHETIITNDMNYKEILNIINDELMDQSHNALLYHQDTFQQIILLELKRFLMVQNVLNTNYKKHYFQLNSTMFSSKYSIIDFIFMMPSTSSSSCNNDLSSSAAAADQQYNVNYEYIYSILIDNLQYNKTIDKLYLKYINKLNNEMKNPPMNNNTKTDKDNDNNNNNNNELYTELDFCSQYFIIRIFIDILFLHNSSNVNKNNMNNNNSIDIDNNNMNKQTTSNVITMENYEAAMMIKFYDIKKYIRNIQSFHCYVELLEILFSLIFLRWEHINENYYDIDFDRTVESGSECTEDDDASSSLKNPTTNEIIDGNRKNTIQKESSKYGFICTNIVLEQFLQLLKTIVTQKKHSEAYQLASTDLQCRFATLHEQINDAQWRLTLFSGTSSSSPPSKTIIFNSTSNNTDVIKCDVNNQNTDNNIQILQNITKYLNSYKIIDVYPQQIRKLSTDDDDDDDDDNDDDNDDNVDDDVDDEGDCDDEQDNYIDNKNNNNILDNNFKISSTTSTGTTTTTSTSIHQNKNNNNKLQQSTMMTKRKLRKKSAKKFDSSEKGFFSHSTDNERKNSCTKLPNYDVQQEQQKPQQQIEHPNIDEQHKTNNKQMYNIIKSKRNIINKMLGTSENLISICLCNGDMETARQIIKNNNLENSAIAIEIGFLEMLTNTKQKLREIFDKYKKQDLSSVGKKLKKLEKISQQEQEHQPQQQQPTSTTTHSSDQSSHSNVKLIHSLERIRKIASVGFEISKITNIMENFAITSQLHECRTDMKQILEKYLVQYKNLLQFKNEQIQSTILIDLIISLSNNYDICLNIYDLLTKLWKLNDNKMAEELIIDGSTKLSINQSQQQQQQFKSAQGPGPTVPVPPQITINNDFTINYNPLNTLKIFIECLKQYKNIAKEHFGIEHLLYEECCYKLRSNDIQIHLEKEQLFKQLAGITFNELNTIDKLKLHLKSFNQIKCCDLNYFNRIYGFIVNASRLLQFNESSHCKKSDVDLNENNQSNKNVNNNNNNNNKTPLEILNLNLIQLIGEIIFEKQINPIEIENILFNMNINLLYAIILNVCEPIANKNPNNNNDQNTNNYYLNSLIAEFNLNDDEITDRKKFNFNNLMIIEKQNQGKLYKLCDNVNNLIIIDYVKKHNQLIAYLLQEIHAVHPKSSQNHVVVGDITQSQSKKLDGQSSMGVSKGSTTTTTTPTTTKEMNTHFNNKSSSSYFQNLMNTNEIQVYSLIYNNNNNAWAALNYDVFNVYDLIMYIKRTGDLRIPLEIIQNYKDIDYNRNYLLLNRLKDLLIIEMLNNDTDDKQIREESSSVVDISGSTNDEEDQDDQDDDDENDYLNYKTQHNPNLNITIIEQITDINLQANILIKKFNTINSGELVIRLIRNILLHQNVSKLNAAIHQQLKTQLENINIYLQIQEIFPDKNKKTWLEIMKISNELPECILEMLIEYGEYELCYEWSKIHPLRNYMDKYSEFIIIFTTEILQENPKNTILFKLIESLPKERVFHFYNKMLIGHRNIKLLNYLIDYLIKSSTTSTSTSTSSVSGTMNTNLNVYQKYRISLKIFEMLSESTDTVAAAAAAVDERDRLWNLISAPALIIEQYIMNSKFDMLKKILDKIRPLLNEIKCDYCLKQTKSNQTIKHHKKSSSYDSTKINKSKLKVVNVSGYAPQPTPATMNRNNNNNTDDNHTDMNLKFNLYEHSLGIECIDALLRVYASKALDFRIISDGGAYTHASAAAAASSSSSSTDQSSMDMTSLDSLCGIFVMPKEPPKKQQWIRDSDATHCMCCRRAVFTMLTRRHHCRRCGRVVCHACSRKRITITNLYADILVRICDDCNKQTDLINVKLSKVNQSQPPNVIQQSTVNKSIVDYNIEWEFSGNPKHDNLLRDEFCYEFAPSVSLCLNILEFHSPTPAYVKFLLYYCKKFERLLRPIQPGFPNPEIDYILVTRMLHCLSLAAKVRGGPPECDIIRDHSEIIRSIVNNGCESLLPMESPNCSSFRKLRDSLVIAEKWTLALDLSLKCGFTTTGVLATWGMACLRAGCFDTAREKFTYCMTKTTTDEEISKIKLIIIQECMSSLSSSSSSSQTGIKIKKGTNKKQSIIDVKSSIKVRRPVKSPPLLNEIINILEIMCHPIRLAVLTRASQIRDSNTSLASNKSKNKENIPIYEPSINILHTLSNLKQIAYGGGNLTGNVATIIGSSIDPQIHSSSTIPNNNDDDDDGDEGIIAGTSKMSSITTKGSSTSAASAAAAAASAASVASSTLKPFDYERIKPNTKFYDECLYYLIAYGSHFDIVRFLIKHNQIFIALKYLLYQQIDCDIFLQLILMPNLKCGKLNVIIAYMLELDETLLAWKQYIVHTCRYLERKHLLNSLYHLQMLLKDPVRASMTCVKFYSMDAHSYKDLLTNSYHLLNAQQHLQAELDLCQWEEIKVHSSMFVHGDGHGDDGDRDGDGNEMMNRSMEEEVRSLVMKMDSKTLNVHISTIWRQIEVTKFLTKCELNNRETVGVLPKIFMDYARLPTLFGSLQEKIQLTVLTIVCGINVEEGFGLAYRIIQDFNLNMIKVYGITAKYLVTTNRINDVEKLIDCIRGNNQRDAQICDEILCLAVETAVRKFGTQIKMIIDNLIRLINDVGMKINCHIVTGQLKSAYLLAVQQNRIDDIRKVLKHAELTNQIHVKRLCEKKLNLLHSTTVTVSNSNRFQLNNEDNDDMSAGSSNNSENVHQKN